MSKIKILVTGRKLKDRNFYQVTKVADGQVKVVRHGNTEMGPKQVDLVKQLGGPENVLARCVEFEGTLQQFVSGQFAMASLSRKEADMGRSVKLDQLWAEAHQVIDTATAIQLYALFDKMNKYDDHKSTTIHDFFFLGENALVEALKEATGGYRSDCFDDGTVVINAFAPGSKKRWSNKRKFATTGSILDLIKG